jgi:hypothetical protein
MAFKECSSYVQVLGMPVFSIMVLCFSITLLKLVLWTERTEIHRKAGHYSPNGIFSNTDVRASELRTKSFPFTSVSQFVTQRQSLKLPTLRNC